MSDAATDATAAAEQEPAPLVPPLPSRGRRGARRPGRRSDPRWLIWAAALAVGVAAGVACYRYVSPVTSYFDYWYARLLG